MVDFPAEVSRAGGSTVLVRVSHGRRSPCRSRRLGRVNIGKGDIAPDFELPDQDGTPRRLSDLVADGPVVLFFYPAAMTRGCTAEACHFRDLAAEYRAAGVQRVGISRDPVERQKE